jgi:uncharacterized Zn finger protein (UPF0148 family)
VVVLQCILALAPMKMLMLIVKFIDRAWILKIKKMKRRVKMFNCCPVCGGELRILTGSAYCENCKAQFRYGNTNKRYVQLLEKAGKSSYKIERIKDIDKIKDNIRKACRD